LHFFWIILGLLTIVIFILGVIFGVISFVGKDGVQVFNFIFSTENLSNANPVIITDKTAGNYLNVCLNSNC
jgi:hypothetical protein